MSRASPVCSVQCTLVEAQIIKIQIFPEKWCGLDDKFHLFSCGKIKYCILWLTLYAPYFIGKIIFIFLNFQSANLEQASLRALQLTKAPSTYTSSDFILYILQQNIGCKKAPKCVVYCIDIVLCYIKSDIITQLTLRKGFQFEKLDAVSYCYKSDRYITIISCGSSRSMVYS